MTRDASPDFDLSALHAALDAERRARRLSWQELAREVSQQFAGVPVPPISPTTFTGLATRTAAEGDGVLQMLRWLGRSPESFVPGYQSPSGHDETLPSVATNQLLRFDTKALYAALDARRAEQRLSWVEVAAAIGGVNAAGLTQLSKGGRTAFPLVVRLTRWLGRPVADFTRGFEL
jgi:hypothetical protein